MMAQFGLNLGNPQNYSDWTKYAGFSPTASVTGMDMSSSEIQPVAPTTQQMTDTFSKIGDQLGSGNLIGAYQAYVGKKPIAPTAPKTSTPQVQPVPQVTGFGHDFEG
jgi:hypothetical protein